MFVTQRSNGAPHTLTGDEELELCFRAVSRKRLKIIAPLAATRVDPRLFSRVRVAVSQKRTYVRRGSSSADRSRVSEHHVARRDVAQTVSTIFLRISLTGISHCDGIFFHSSMFDRNFGERNFASFARSFLRRTFDVQSRSCGSKRYLRTKSSGNSPVSNVLRDSVRFSVPPRQSSRVISITSDRSLAKIFANIC